MTTTCATAAWTRAETDPERTAILAAADRMLAGKPTNSTGRLSVVQLAIEAQVKYWVVAQKHPDLRDHFQRLATQARTEPAHLADQSPMRSGTSELERLTKRCAELEDLVATYAQVINELSNENAVLRKQQSGTDRTVRPLQRRESN